MKKEFDNLTLMKDCKISLIDIRQGTNESNKFDVGLVIFVYKY